MRFFKSILYIVVLCMAGHAHAQVRHAADSVGSAGWIRSYQEKMPINQVDAKGRRTGSWWITTPERMGEPANTEFGNYDHGRKIGAWCVMDGQGDLISIENYRNNVLDGEVKYYERGRISVVGHYRGLNPAHEYDTIVVTDPTTNIDKLVRVSADRGTLRHGMWRYYNPDTGKLIAEEEYQVDDLIYKKEVMLTKQDSLYFKKREQNMPHVTGKMYHPPAGKNPYSYLDE